MRTSEYLIKCKKIFIVLFLKEIKIEEKKI